MTWRQILNELQNAPDGRLDREAILYLPGLNDPALMIRITKLDTVDRELAEDYEVAEDELLLLGKAI